MTSYTVPGVYIEEPFGLSLSINEGATAIPVFARDETTYPHVTVNPYFPLDDTVREFDTWLDVMGRVSAARAAAVQAAVTKESTQEGKEAAGKTAGTAFDTAAATALDHCVLFQSLKAFFSNGGGRCYVATVGSLDEVVPGLDDVTLLVQAGTALATFSPQVTALCKPGNTCFAIFDGPNKPEPLTTMADAQAATDPYPPNAYAAVYYPWLQVSVPDAGNPKQQVPFDVPPSAAVAGAYCTVDSTRGVWKAPANVEIRGLTPKHKVSDVVDGALNVPSSGGKAINVIRAFRGTGPLVWGARTLQSDQDTWRYVPVRRLFSAAEKDIRGAMSVALFEPNSAPTWERVRAAVENYLHRLWQQGALQGSTPQAAYFVHIGRGLTMTEDDINQGRMIIKVGMAAVRPAEFIILQLTQDVVPA